MQKFVVGLEPPGLGLKPNYKRPVIFYFNSDHLLINQIASALRITTHWIIIEWSNMFLWS